MTILHIYCKGIPLLWLPTQVNTSQTIWTSVNFNRGFIRNNFILYYDIKVAFLCFHTNALQTLFFPFRIRLIKQNQTESDQNRNTTYLPESFMKHHRFIINTFIWTEMTVSLSTSSRLLIVSELIGLKLRAIEIQNKRICCQLEGLMSLRRWCHAALFGLFGANCVTTVSKSDSSWGYDSPVFPYEG